MTVTRQHVRRSDSQSTDRCILKKQSNQRVATKLPDEPQKAHFAAVEFSDTGYAVDVPDKLFRCTEEDLECRIPVASTRHVAAWPNDHLDLPRRGPVLSR